MDPRKVVLAEIVRTRGVMGELVARSLTDVPGRLEQLKSAQVDLPDGSSLPIKVRAAWPHKTGWVLTFEGVDSIEKAERFRGADLWVPHANRATLETGEFFQSDLIGCQVLNSTTGETVGVVSGWQQYGGPPLMEVTMGAKERLIPFVQSWCEVDLVLRVIRAQLPKGLLDL